MSLETRKNFGWIPSLPDPRDKMFRAVQPISSEQAGPPVVDLCQNHTFNVYDQGNLGACVAHASASALEYTHGVLKSKTLRRQIDIMASRLFIYYEARKAIGMVQEDSGCNIRDAMRVLYNVGAPSEHGWSYNESVFNAPPPGASYRSAPYHKITSYHAVGVDIPEIRTALQQNMPVIIGISVFDSFPMTLGNPVIPMPGRYESVIGGHAMLIVGYDDDSRMIKVLNSWGSDWGSGGFGLIPYDYVGSPAFGDDYWVITDDRYKENM